MEKLAEEFDAVGFYVSGHPLDEYMDTLARIQHTLRDMRRYKELFRMLVAFWFYMEGIGAIILLATAVGAARAAEWTRRLDLR